MSLKQSVRTPSSYGGLMRYFDETKSRLILKPEHIIIMTVGVMVVVMALHMLF